MPVAVASPLGEDDRETRARTSDYLPTDVGPSLNEPQLSDVTRPAEAAEPTGDASVWESALQHPDLLGQAAGGQMTSLDLLKALLARRGQQPPLGGGLQ
jgi:hypothetical protein